jgi:hypothetical protein
VKRAAARAMRCESSQQIEKGLDGARLETPPVEADDE